MSLEVSDNITDLRSWFLALEALRSAAPDDDADDTDDTDDGEDDDDDSGSGGTGEEADQGGKPDVGDPDKKKLSDEAAKWRRLRREERVAREAAEARLRELEDKDKGDAEKLQGQLETVTKERDELRKQYEELARETAISRAAQGKNINDLDYLELLLNKEGVEYVDEDGAPADLRDVVDSLIKRKPSLVATGGGKDEDDDKDDASQGQPSGRRTDGKQKGNKNGMDFETLARKFPALARR